MLRAATARGGIEGEARVEVLGSRLLSVTSWGFDDGRGSQSVPTVEVADYLGYLWSHLVVLCLGYRQ